MPSKKLLWLVFFIIIGCTPSTTTTPYATPFIWQIARTPSLSWLDQSFNLCIQEQNENKIIVREASLDSTTFNQADISFIWGKPVQLQEFAFTLGEDELIFVVHPDNPLQEISLETLRNIYSKQEVYWNHEQSGIVIPWKYPENNEIERLAEGLIGNSIEINVQLSTTPDIPGMLAQISLNPDAIGFLPKNRIDSSVKPIRITGLSPKSTSFPVVVTLQTQPDRFQTLWLACVQEKIASDQ